MQSIRPPSFRKLHWAVSFLVIHLRRVLLPLFLLAAAILALPALGIGALIWWRASKTWDYREWWSGVWLLALVGVLMYSLLVRFGHPLSYLSHILLSYLPYGFLPVPFIWLVSLWLLHLLLTPVCALTLEGLYPMTKRTRLKPRYQIPPKKADNHEKLVSVQQSNTASGQTLQASRVQLLKASLMPQSAPIGHLPVVHLPPPEPLGAYIGGDLYEWVYSNQFCFPLTELMRHGVVIGEPGYGKTVTLLRLAMIAVRYGMQIIYMDLKSSKKTGAQFIAAMHLMGVKRIRVYPREAYDGWRGDANALYNRLMAMLDPGTHPYYYKLTSSLVSLAVHAPSGPPHDSQDFLMRLDENWLKRAYAGRAHWYAQRKISKLEPHIYDLSLTYDGFFDGVMGGLDGHWALEDADAVYIGLDSDALKEQAASMGRYLLEDFAHYAKHRKPSSIHALVIIDEFGVLKTSNATDLYERVREPGMSIYASAQSYEGLGPERAQVLAAAAIKIMHRCGDPEEIIKFAGMREVPAFSQILDEENEEDVLPFSDNREIQKRRMAIHMQREYTMPIEDVQQLTLGRIALITGGLGAWIQVYPPALPTELVQAALGLVSTPPPLTPTQHRQSPFASKKVSQTKADRANQKIPKQPSSASRQSSTGSPSASKTANIVSPLSSSAAPDKQPALQDSVRTEDVATTTNQTSVDDLDDSPVDFFR